MDQESAATLASMALDEMERLGWARRHEHCYDFPLAVIHVGTCGHYVEGGVCRPMPMPVPPFTDDEKGAIMGYMSFVSGRITNARIIHPPGVTVIQAMKTSES